MPATVRLHAVRSIPIGLLLILALGCGASGNSSTANPPPDAGLTPGRYERALTRWPLRPYHLYVPTSFDPSHESPVVVAIHGGGADADNAEKITCPNGDLSSADCLDALADREGFVLAFPNGTLDPSTPGGRTFNAGGGGGYACMAPNSCDPPVDDVAYFLDLLEDLRSAIAVDSKRVFATGMSDGAAMSHRLACQLAGVFAAIGPVAGGNQFATGAPCEPAREVPVIEIHGDADPLWPYEGGLLPELRPPGLGISIPDTLSGWASRNGCRASPTEARLPSTIDDGTSVTQLSYRDCANGGDVEHYRIVGGGHTWPRGNPYASEAKIGKTSLQISANEIIWSFFQSHPMP